MNYTTYTTKEGDRLDTIAQRLYGDSGRWAELIAQNPGLPIEPNYPAGLLIKAPILTEEQSREITDQLPPWKV